MLGLNSGSLGIEHAQAVIVLLAIIGVTFWRTLVKIVLMIAMALFITLIAFGAVTLLEGMQHVIK